MISASSAVASLQYTLTIETFLDDAGQKASVIEMGVGEHHRVEAVLASKGVGSQFFSALAS